MMKIVYGISPFHSNCMLSDNPHSGIYVATTARTLDMNGGNPTCSQGGMMVVEDDDYYGNNEHISDRNGRREDSISFGI